MRVGFTLVHVMSMIGQVLPTSGGGKVHHEVLQLRSTMDPEAGMGVGLAPNKGQVREQLALLKKKIHNQSGSRRSQVRALVLPAEPKTWS